MVSFILGNADLILSTGAKVYSWMMDAARMKRNNKVRTYLDMVAYVAQHIPVFETIFSSLYRGVKALLQTWSSFRDRNRPAATVL